MRDVDGVVPVDLRIGVEGLQYTVVPALGVAGRKDWVVWSREWQTKEDRTPRGFENVGNTVFCEKAKRNKKEQGEPEAEEETALANAEPNGGFDVIGRARRQRGWWKRGAVQNYNEHS